MFVLAMQVVISPPLETNNISMVSLFYGVTVIVQMYTLGSVDYPVSR